MRDAAVLVLIATLVWLSAWFVTFEPDMTRWSELGRYVYLVFVLFGFMAYMLSPWRKK